MKAPGRPSQSSASRAERRRYVALPIGHIRKHIAALRTSRATSGEILTGDGKPTAGVVNRIFAVRKPGHKPVINRLTNGNSGPWRVKVKAGRPSVKFPARQVRRPATQQARRPALQDPTAPCQITCRASPPVLKPPPDESRKHIVSTVGTRTAGAKAPAAFWR